MMELGKSNRAHEPDTTSDASAELASPAAPKFWIVPPGNGEELAQAPGALPHDDVPDVALIAALAAGEVEALGALYDRHAHVVFTLLLRIVGDRDAAEELLQEVFLRVWQHALAFDDTRGTLRGWLYGMAHNMALNELRRRRRRPQLQQSSASARHEDDAGTVSTGPDPAIGAWCALRDAELAYALDQLPPNQRAVLLLYAEGYSQSEIAVRLGEPLGTIKSRMRRALCRLRETLPILGIDAGWRSD
jgi:RNA polymerase sigma-70 factor (ECF subfamily)